MVHDLRLAGLVSVGPRPVEKSYSEETDSLEYQIVTTAVDTGTASAWNECLESADFAAQYVAPEFLVEGYFRPKQPFAVLAREGGVVAGVVTGFHEGKDILCGHSGSPNVCVRRGVNLEQVGRVLAAGLRAHARGSVELVIVCAWSEIPGFRQDGFRFHRYEPPVCPVLLDPSMGTDRLFRACSQTRRNLIRRALKSGVEVKQIDVEKDFDDCYALYTHWCSFKNIPCVPYDTQRTAFADTGSRLVLVARHEGRIVGVSSFRYRKGGLVEYAANISRREETRIRQNDLLLWRGIEWTVQQGTFTHFSMAASHFFLRTYGGELHPTYRYSLDRTFLRRRHLGEKLRGSALRTYRRLPDRLQGAIKRLRHLQNDDV
jgi:hypothetical protein